MRPLSLLRRPHQRAAVQAAKRLPRDPAPSKWKYRYQRWMLTPGIRTGVQIGTPLLIVAVVAGSWIGQQSNRAMITQSFADMKAAVQQRPEFKLTRMEVLGADDQTVADVLTMLPLAFPVSSFDLDLNEMRDTVEDLYAVESARVRVGNGGVLEVEITPRVPVAVWRDKGTLRLIDAGQVTSGIIETRADRRDLPLIAGDGAHAYLEEALALFETATPIKDRVRGLVRMGERRWDMVLDKGVRLMLPEEGSIAALDRIIALNEAQDMLNRDIAAVDLRNADRPVLRMTADAANALRRISDRGEDD